MKISNVFILVTIQHLTFCSEVKLQDVVAMNL
jgi:hypothetical protein